MSTKKIDLSMLATRIRKENGKKLASVVATGLLLRTAQNNMDKSTNFYAWALKHTGISRATVIRYLHVATIFAKHVNSSLEIKTPLNVIYSVLEKPIINRNDLLARIFNGELVSKDDLKYNNAPPVVVTPMDKASARIRLMNNHLTSLSAPDSIKDLLKLNVKDRGHLLTSLETMEKAIQQMKASLNAGNTTATKKTAKR